MLEPVAPSPRMEAERLVAHVLKCSRTALLAHPEWTISAATAERLIRMVQRRATGYPLPYVLGYAEFYGLRFEITADVLIPRPETETLIDLALDHQPRTIIDVGTGSGCIAVSLATHLPHAYVHAIDISSAALAIARRNARAHGVLRTADGGHRVRFTCGDLLDPLPAPVDLIVSNPPYVAADEFPSLQASVRAHEPALALDGGDDGLTPIRRLLAQAPAALNPGGTLLIEIGASQGAAVTALASTAFPHGTVRIHPDLAGRDRVLRVQT